MTSTLLAIDVGTGSIRAALVDVQGNVRAFAARPHDQHVPRAGWSEQSPADWWRGVVATVREVMHEHASQGLAPIAAIAAGGQMHGPVPIGADGEVLLDRVQLWNDKRPTAICAAFTAKQDAASLLRRTANPPAPSWTAFKVAWIREHQPEVYDRAQTFLTPKDYVNFMLTGVRATDHSEASGSFVFDCSTRAFDADLAGLVGVDVTKFPSTHEATAVIGEVTGAAAGETGLQAGLPVVAGAGDFLAALLGSGVVAPGIGSDITGTSNLISVYADGPLHDPRIMNLCGAGGGWVPFTMIDAGGDSLRWARDTFDAADTDFGMVSAGAAAVPGGCEGLVFLPYLSGERLGGRANARAQFFGLTTRHGKGHLYRAVMEGVAFASRRNIDLMRAAGARFERLIAAGGGAKGDLWLRIKASIYDLPIIVPENPESSVLGCAALAGIGTGIFSNVGDAVGNLVRHRRPILPDPALVDRYARLREVFNDLSSGSYAFYDRLDDAIEPRETEREI